MSDYDYHDFMDRLHNQTTCGEEALRTRQDKAIMRVLISWARKQTAEFDRESVAEDLKDEFNDAYDSATEDPW